jgi:hypothetical protein
MVHVQLKQQIACPDWREQTCILDDLQHTVCVILADFVGGSLHTSANSEQGCWPH